MPATEETYYRQPTLHVIFAVSSVAMLLSIVWMIMADHLRPWKAVQRDFHRVEDRKLQAAEQEKLAIQKEKYQAEIDKVDQQIEQAKQGAIQRAADLKSVEYELKKLGGRTERLDTEKKFQKAELDSLRSLYDGMVERGEEREARAFLNSKVADAERKLLTLSRELETAQAEQKVKTDAKKKLEGGVEDLEKEKSRLTREVDRVARLKEQKENQYFGVLAWLRSLPGVDMAASPTKIQQISLPELTINYNFKEVPRYDRCTTCHQGIDRLGYQKDEKGEKMTPVFAAHPFLQEGATTIDPKGNVVKAGLYLDGNGPHPINDFGCTICHGGQGSGTDFTFASHTPANLKVAEEWKKEYGWQEIHHWDYPMQPQRFLESSCLKCHHDVTDVPQAKQLQAGYQRIVQYGCTGCHTIGGEGSFGPDLTEERQVGPNLGHVASKVSKDWIVKWIKNPHAFRPDSRMPRFYGVTNNGAAEDQPKNDAEIHAISHYLFAKSTPPGDFVDPPANPDPKHGKELFLQKGCLACHQHRPYKTAPEAEAEVQLRDRKAINPNYKLDPALTYDPTSFPKDVQQFAKADFGPNLSNIAAKFQSQPQGLKWLTNWIQSPERYHPKSLMPNLQLSLQDAADVASWIISTPGEWPVEVKTASIDSDEVKKGLDDLVKLYVTKGGYRKDGKNVAVALSEVDPFVEKLSTDDKLFFLGEKSISRLGCFGCHNIPGFENAKPIGTPLNDWGIKSPARLDFGHVNEYLQDQQKTVKGDRDGTDPFYQEQLGHETRMGFLYQKLHRPRSYDYLKKSEKYKSWDDRLRMPQFAWADDPKAVEEVMTFILGLTGEKINARYVARTKYDKAQIAKAEGAKVLNRFNCGGCHVLDMPKFEIPQGTTTAAAFPSFKTNLRSSYSARNTDFLPQLFPDLSYDPKKKLDDPNIEAELGVKPDDGAAATLEGMPTGQFENEVSIQLWKPVTIRGYTFNVGDTVTLDQTKIERKPGVGGDFAWLYSTHQAEKAGTPVEAFWNRLPPPLIREGLKAQTPWLSLFFKDPYAIRPATQLRMPRFHYGKDVAQASRETEQLADFFAARDAAEFPYQSIPQQQQSYIAEREKAHPDYLNAGWTIMANKGSPCLQCHAVGPFKPTGGDQVINGPDLRQVANRFRPGYLEQWLANPRRLLPYTAMPQNVVPHGPLQIPVPKSFEDQPLEMVRALRDTLLNYTNVIERQMAAGTNPPAAAPAAAAGTGTGATAAAKPAGSSE
ncbi:c-type cytochrome [Paludisphaera borealis]|uniref:Chromosome partition protein Smc n=1 Tax=Paludisphaera borealis TaxID=1387353 RepID=A0A1U7CYF2_9BACT|nr:cytochrome c [Paludisphaera borealis]APW63982.1 Chromosome partition protein Smc [Paludisphaera borealis]